MISGDYALRQLSGVWKMAWNAPDWQEALDRSVDGVFRSFWAVALAAPIAVVGFFSARRAAERLPDIPPSPILEAPFSVSMIIEAAAFFVDWGVSLAALIFVARAMGLARNAGDLVIGYNWLQIFVAIGQAIPIIGLSLTLRTEVGALLALPAIAFIIVLYWGVLRRASNGNIGNVVAMLALLVLIGFVARSVVSSIGFGLYKAFS